MTAPGRTQVFRPGALVAAFFRRDLTIASSYRLPFVLDLGQRVLGVIAFFYLGELIDRHAALPGPEFASGYFGFVLIGVLLVGIVSTTLSSFSERLRADQATGTLETVFAMPLPPSMSVLASATYDLAYASIVAIGTLALAIVALGLHLHTGSVSLVAVAVCLVATVSFFAAVGLVFAAFVVVFKRGNPLAGLFVSALALVGGVYYPTELLPAPLRIVADLLPFTWSLDVLRAALLTNDVAVAELSKLLIATVVAFPTAVSLLNHAVRRARRTGTMGQF